MAGCNPGRTPLIIAGNSRHSHTLNLHSKKQLWRKKLKSSVLERKENSRGIGVSADWPSDVFFVLFWRWSHWSRVTRKRSQFSSHQRHTQPIPRSVIPIVTFSEKGKKRQKLGFRGYSLPHACGHRFCPKNPQKEVLLRNWGETFVGASKPQIKGGKYFVKYEMFLEEGRTCLNYPKFVWGGENTFVWKRRKNPALDS